MDQEHLRNLLAQVQDELARNDSLDEHSRRHLSEVQTDLERALGPATNSEVSSGVEVPPLPPEEQENRQGRLQQAMVALEGSHPQIASALEQGMLALSNLGL